MLNKCYGRLSIVTADEGLTLNDIQYRIVSDIPVNEAASTMDVPYRRCGIEFEVLSPLQKEQLKYFIQNHTLRQIVH